MSKAKKTDDSKDDNNLVDVKSGGRKTGVRVTGSASEGHCLNLKGEDSLRNLFFTDCDFQANALFSQCLKVLSKSESGDSGDSNVQRNFMTSIIHDIAPRDAVERMLSVQMAATHVALVRAAGNFAHATLLPQFEAQERAYNKLARTFAAQMEALRKHRNGGKQTVTVQHVNVEGGGQAIVGDVTHGGGGSDEK